MDFIVVLSGAFSAASVSLEFPEDRVFGFDSQMVVQIIANALNVAILAGFLAYLLYKPVRDILRKRTNKIEGQLMQAEEEMQRATELRQQYEKRIEDVEREREEILSEARKFAADNERRIISDAKQEADAIRERAAQSVKVEWERAENDMRTAIIDVSAVMAEKFVSLAINKETHDRLFDETVADLEGMTWRD